MLISIVLNATAWVTSVHINILFARSVNTNEISCSHRTYLQNSEVEKEFLLKKINGNKKNTKSCFHYLNVDYSNIWFRLERCLFTLMSHISDLLLVAWPANELLIKNQVLHYSKICTWNIEYLLNTIHLNPTSLELWEI